jgi:hypothetical protein
VTITPKMLIKMRDDQETVIAEIQRAIDTGAVDELPLISRETVEARQTEEGHPTAARNIVRWQDNALGFPSPLCLPSGRGVPRLWYIKAEVEAFEADMRRRLEAAKKLGPVNRGILRKLFPDHARWIWRHLVRS